MSEKRIGIVKGGSWGDITPAEYDSQAELLKEFLEIVPDGGKFGKNFASVEIIDDATAAANKVRLREVDVLIFMSRGQKKEAEIIKLANPWLKVIVYTGLIPDDAVIYINKTWPLNLLEDIIRLL